MRRRAKSASGMRDLRRSVYVRDLDGGAENQQ